jgi:hypothetical protein
MHTMLLHSTAPTSFWPDALATTTYHLNRHPCHVRQHATSHELLLGHPPDYDHLRVFRSLCFPSTATTSPHKLAPHSTSCIFIGYLAETMGYRCYNLDTRRVITSRHVYFDESVFSFKSLSIAFAPAALPPVPPCDTVFVPAPLSWPNWQPHASPATAPPASPPQHTTPEPAHAPPIPQPTDPV